MVKALDQKLPAEKTITEWIDFLKTKTVIKKAEAVICKDQDNRNLSTARIQKDKNLNAAQKNTFPVWFHPIRYRAAIIAKNQILSVIVAVMKKHTQKKHYKKTTVS
ncbi:hypothetical protein H9W95_17370 [Flavobacterium lindanitolerans]|nr:hypothetical protein [Flavobacterium lindanitolerans]